MFKVVFRIMEKLYYASTYPDEVEAILGNELESVE